MGDPDLAANITFYGQHKRHILTRAAREVAPFASNVFPKDRALQNYSSTVGLSFLCCGDFHGILRP